MAAQERNWTREAIRIIEADFQRSADTHLIPLDMPGLPGVDLYFKDESSHPTGSLKHRLARSLFLYALCNGWLRPGAPVIEASSGSTAISEAYFARLLGVPFIAVVPASTSKEKIAQIAFYGGQAHLVDDPTQIYAESERLAKETGGHFMDQFTYAERATDWRANNNIAESIFQQMRHERFPEPAWLVSSPGTGGTLATLGASPATAGMTPVCALRRRRTLGVLRFLPHRRPRPHPELRLAHRRHRPPARGSVVPAQRAGCLLQGAG